MPPFDGRLCFVPSPSHRTASAVSFFRIGKARVYDLDIPPKEREFLQREHKKVPVPIGNSSIIEPPEIMPFHFQEQKREIPRFTSTITDSVRLCPTCTIGGEEGEVKSQSTV